MKERFLLETFTAQQHLTPMMNLFLVPICELTNFSYVNFRFEKRVQRKKEEATKFIHHQRNGQKVKGKMRRNSGQAYVSSSGKLVPAKTTQNVICCCRFSQMQEKMNFESFGLWVI